MQAAGVQRARQLDRVCRPADVHCGVLLCGSGHVVDRREMQHMVDLSAQLLDALGLDSQQRFAQIADHRLHAFARAYPSDGLPALDQVVELVRRALAHQHIHLALTLAEQLLHEPSPDEPGRACDEVGHDQARISVTGCPRRY